MSDFTKVASVDEIGVNEMKSFEVNYERIIVCRTEKGFFALVDECSHDSSPISEGHICEGQVVCPRHGAKFDITTGEVKAPPAVVGIDTYEVKVENNDIFVKVN